MNSEDRLPILREIGYRPYNFALWSSKFVELVSFPYIESELILIQVRTQIGDPTSVTKVPCHELFTLEQLKDNHPDAEALILALGQLLPEYQSTVNRFPPNPRANSVLQKVMDHCEQDASTLDGLPFNGKTVAERLGQIYAMIKAVAKAAKEKS